MKKALQYLVIHCSATPEGRDVSAADIRRWHTAPVSEGGRKACPSFDVGAWLKSIGIE